MNVNSLSLQAANCGVCDEQPGVCIIIQAEVEIWACEVCAEDCAPSRRAVGPRWALANAWQDRDADAAGVPMYGPI